MGEKESFEFEIIFSGIHPHDNDLMVIILRCDIWEINKELIDQRSSIDILYYDTFGRLILDIDDFKAFQGSLVRVSGEQV